MKLKIKLLPLPYYGPEDETGVEKVEKTPVQIERESIKVTSGVKEETEKETEKEEDANDETADKEDDEEKGEEKEEDDDTDKEDEKKELTEEQKQIQALEKKLERAQRRAGKTAAERDENKKLVKELKAALEAKLADGEQPLTQDEVKRQAREMAEVELTQREFNNAQDKLINAAIKVDKTFMSKINDLAAEVAPLPGFFIGALDKLEHDNGGAVLNYLTDNPDDYEEILKKNDPTQIITKLIRISDKLHEASKPKPKKISNAPEPAKAPKGNNRNPDALPPKPTENMSEFIRVRQQQEKARREARGE